MRITGSRRTSGSAAWGSSLGETRRRQITVITATAEVQKLRFRLLIRAARVNT